VRRSYLVLALLVVLIGCRESESDGEMPGRIDAGEAEPASPPAQPSARRPVRLLPLGRFDQPTYVTAPRGDARRFVVEPRAGFG
jgi:hypothetical protein